jgi:dienelactone hydrolase
MNTGQMEDMHPGKKKSANVPILLVISLMLILLGNLGAWFVKTAGGKVTLVGLKFPTESGQWIVADLFKPKIATEKNPVPMVVVCPGFERSKETMDAYSIELARRGIAVITIDPYGQGASSSSLQRRSTTVEGNGVIPIVEYISGTPNINYIDKSKIGAVGYSSGGNAVLQSAARFGEREEKALKKAKSAKSDGGTDITDAELARAQALNKIAAIYIGGYVLTLTDEVLAPVRANIGMDYAYFDEGAFRNAQGHARMQEAPEALRLVNTIFPEKPLTSVKLGEMYGDLNARTLRLVHNTRNIHPLLPYDRTHIENVANYFTTVFGMQPTLSGSSQIWPLKEFFTLLSLVGAFLFLVPFTSLLLRLPLFASLVKPVPQALPAPSRNGKILFWVLFCGSAIAACFLFIPLAKATAVLFHQASSRIPTWWFPQRINNAILLWAVANGLIGLITFFLTYKLHGKKNGVTPEMWGIKTTGKELALTFALAISVFVTFYALLFASYGVFHTDFRFVFVSAAASFPNRMLLVALEYLPAFFIFYLANSIRVNSGSRFQGQREWLNMLINGFGNSVGLMMILAIQYSVFVWTGTIYWKEEWLYVNLLLGVIPMMFVLPYFNRYFFRLTGKVYLGPMITCLIFVMMMLTSNVCYIPIG